MIKSWSIVDYFPVYCVDGANIILTIFFFFHIEVGGNSRPSTPTQGKSNLVTTVSQPEKEQIAMQWLKATFEPLVGAPSIEQNVLYKQYTAGCSKNGPKYLLATMQFYSCVRYGVGFINIGCIYQWIVSIDREFGQ